MKGETIETVQKIIEKNKVKRKERIQMREEDEYRNKKI